MPRRMRQSDGGCSARGSRAERGNVLLAVALVLAALVVLAAASLTLAPTSSDGGPDTAPTEADFDVLQEGLTGVFTESNDTLDPAYQPTFEEPGHQGPSHVDYDTVGELLQTQPVTRGQVVNAKYLMASLASRRLGATIASLEPVPARTENGTLVRLGNDEAHDFGGNQTTLVENATGIQDLAVVFERETLPFGADNATLFRVGDWTLAAYQDTSTGRVNYQLGAYDPAGDWRQTAPDADLRVTPHQNTVNGVPVEDGSLDIDPGDTPFEVTVEDTRWAGTPPEFPGTHGGVSFVATGVGPGETGEAVSATDRQEVVTRMVLDVTYVDTSTTVTNRVSVDPTYRYFVYEASDTRRDPRVGIETSVETVTLGGQEGVLINDTDGAPLTTVVQYWNGTTTEVTDETGYEIPAGYGGSATIAHGDGPRFVPLLLLDEEHKLTATYEISAGGETHVFEETLPVTVISPITNVSVDIETATVANTEGLLPVVDDEYNVTVTGEFIDGVERSVATHPDVEVTVTGTDHVDVDEQNLTLSPTAVTGDGESVWVNASFLPTPAYEQPGTEPLASGTGTAKVADPVQWVDVDIDSESQALPLDVDEYVLQGQGYTFETVVGLVNTTTVDVQDSEWVEHSFGPPHAGNPPATLNESGDGLLLEPEAVTAPGDPLTLQATYTFGENATGADSVAILDLGSPELAVNITREQLSISDVANVSMAVAYETDGPWPDEIAVEPTPEAVTNCTTTYEISASCGARPYNVTGHFHGEGELEGAVDESAVLDITGEELVAGDVVTVGLSGEHVPFDPPIPPHRATLSVWQPSGETGTPQLQALSANFTLTEEDILDYEDPYGWMDNGIVVNNNATADVYADVPTQVQAQSNVEAADAYDLGERVIPPYLVGDFTGGQNQSCTAGCWELTEVSFDGGKFDEREPFAGPEYRTEGFTPREAGLFEVDSEVNYLQVPESIEEKYEQAGIGEGITAGTLDVPVIGGIQYNVTLGEEALYNQSEGELLNTAVSVSQDAGLLTVETDLLNIGNETGLFDVTFEILGSQINSKQQTGIKLEPGEEALGLSQTFFEVPPPGEYVAKVRTRDGTVIDSTTFSVEEQTPQPELFNLNIAGQGNNATIDQGENKNISVKIKNIGNDDGYFDVSLDIFEGPSKNITTENINPGEKSTIVFESVTGGLDSNVQAGYNVQISVNNETSSLTGTLSVKPSQ